MHRRQTQPRTWLIVDRRTVDVEAAVRDLGQGSGILLLKEDLGPRERERLVRRLHMLTRSKGIPIVHDLRDIARVHDVRELRLALLRRTPMILLSPIFATRSHPSWSALPRMRAATLARLAERRLLALGGMDARRYALVKDLGFAGWAGIDAFRT